MEPKTERAIRMLCWSWVYVAWLLICLYFASMMSPVYFVYDGSEHQFKLGPVKEK
jgi:hypothetical protein